MRFSITPWAVICGLIFFPVSALGADVAKIGVMDFQRVLMTSSEGKKAQAEINRKGKKMETELKQKGDAIAKIKKQLEREALVISKAKREEREREIRIKINDLKSLQKRYMQGFKAHEQRLVARIQKDLKKIIDDIGKKEGYLLIIEKRQGGVLYAPQSVDLTDRLIMEYNAQSAQKSTKSQ